MGLCFAQNLGSGTIPIEALDRDTKAARLESRRYDMRASRQRRRRVQTLDPFPFLGRAHARKPQSSFTVRAAVPRLAPYLRF